MDEPVEIDVDLDVQEILLAASQHDIPKLRRLIRANDRVADPVNVRDPETGYTPLHAAIAACELENNASATTNGAQSHMVNGTASHAVNGGGIGGQEEQATSEEAGSAEKSEHEQMLESGAKTVRFLLQEGAIWNDLDRNDETPGCLARRIGARELYEVMVDAGVRAELLLNRLDEYQALSENENEDEDDDEQLQGESDNTANAETESDAVPQLVERANPAEAPSSTAPETSDQVNNERYLSSTLAISSSRILDSASNGVMMSWESDLMHKTAVSLLPRPGLRVLNIGHGMGIIDSFIQTLNPSSHHIIEAHPTVLNEMSQKGWPTKPGVTIHSGRWQDILPKLIEEGQVFDAIYYDTFAESYKDFRDFFSEHVIGLLEPERGRWSFFNGMGADRQISYDVYQKVVEMDLFEAGFDVDWEEVEVPDLEREGEWDGVRRKYWVVDKYRLPICKFMD